MYSEMIRADAALWKAGTVEGGDVVDYGDFLCLRESILVTAQVEIPDCQDGHGQFSDIMPACKKTRTDSSNLQDVIVVIMVVSYLKVIDSIFMKLFLYDFLLLIIIHDVDRFHYSFGDLIEVIEGKRDGQLIILPAGSMSGTNT